MFFFFIKQANGIIDGIRDNTIKSKNLLELYVYGERRRLLRCFLMICGSSTIESTTPRMLIE